MILWIFIAFILLDLTVVGLLFVPAVQTFVVGKVTDKLTEKWGTEISMKDIHITPTLKLVAHDFRICDHHHNDMIFVGTVKGRLNYFKLKPLKLVFHQIDLDKANVVVRKYAGEPSVNFAVWAKVFPHKETHSQFLLTATNLKLANSRVAIVNDDQRKVLDTKGNPDIDYAYYELSDVLMDCDDFKVHSTGFTTIAAKFNHLAYNQYNGFSLSDGKGDFSICDTSLVFNDMRLVTPHSNLNMDLAFYYPNWAGMGEFVDSVCFKTSIHPSQLGMQDVVAHAPSLKGMDETLMIEADRFEGPIRDFQLIGLHAGWGMGTQLNGDFACKDILNFKHAQITANIDSSQVNVPELANLTLPGGKKIPINRTLAKFGNTSLKCFFSGTTSEFDAKVDANTSLGKLYANLGTFVEDGKLQFEGSVSSPSLNLARLTNSAKILGTTGAHLSVDGEMASSTLDADNFKTLKAHLSGDVQHVDLRGYRLRNTKIKADYQDKFYNCTVVGSDPNFNGSVIVQLDLTEDMPSLQGNISLDKLDAGAIALSLPSIDSSKAKGFDKLLCSLQKNPQLKISFDNFAVVLHGSNLENVNGYAACDNVRIYSNGDSLLGDRIRLTAFNTENTHKFILASGIANSTLETSYHLNSIKDTLRNLAHAFFPKLVSSNTANVAVNIPQVQEENDVPGFLKMHVTTYRSWNVLRMLLPDVFIAPYSTIDLSVTSDHRADKIQADVPFFAIRNKFAVHNLILDGNASTTKSLDLALKSDSILAVLGKTRMPFTKVDMKASALNDSIQYKLEWFNEFNEKESSVSRLAGSMNLADADDIAFILRNSVLYLNDIAWQFNDDNEIHLQNGSISVNDLLLYNGNSNISVDGQFNKGTRDRLHVQAHDFDLGVLNSIAGDLGIGGTLSVDANMIYPKDRMIVFGKVLADEFMFNNSKMGDLFVVAGLDTTGGVGFSGGIFQNENNARVTVQDYSYRDFQKESNIVAHLNGRYETDKKNFSAQAAFDTLQIGFIAPFLSSFSDVFSGTASGKLSLVANPKTTYLDGTVTAVDVLMGIAVLGTTYRVKNQDIRFNSEGIFFDNMQILDKNGDMATMTGSIKHRFFKDMMIDLGIHTDRAMVLNAPKNPTAVFYGDGIVSGDVAIKGDGNHIRFTGPNLRTLDGSRIVLQVTSASTASQSNAIVFTPKQWEQTPSAEVFDKKKSPTVLDFDFTFNVTNDADVVLYLESIGGTMNARADGKFQLLYRDDELNLYGDLGLHSGDFKISLFNIVNSRFTLVPGGNIHFDGPLEDMTVSVSAYKSSKTSLSSIIPADYSGGGTTNVNAYLNLNGPIMQRIEPTFSFELPNSNEELSNMFFTAIDTTNKENITRQFAYFLLTNSFMPNSLEVSSGIPGMNMFSNIVNNMLKDLFASRNGSFGITYNQATESSSAEYGVTGSANLLKDRMTLETSIGYYDDKNTQALYNMYGDFTVNYNINKEGTWKVKAYTYIGQRDENFYYQNDQFRYTAGVALAYKQDFNTPRRKGKTIKEKRTKKTKASKVKTDEKH